MEPQERMLIGELARLAGVTPRTIRYYTSEGLLPAPTTRGKYAHYDGEHLRRLRLIARLKEDYLPLSAIRERLATMSAAEGERLLGERRQGRAPGEGVGAREGGPGMRLPPQAGPAHPAPQGSAGMLAERPASYELSGAGEPGGQPPDAAELLAASFANPFRLTPASLPLGRVEFFPAAPEEGDGREDQERDASRGEELWRHFALAPGVELRVREPLSPRRRRQIAAILAAMRDRLLSEED